MEQQYHIPVLLNECIEALVINPDGIYVDVTFGGGGHSREILKYLNKGKLYAFDQDPDAALNIPENENLIFIPHNFGSMKNWLAFHGVDQVDGILADLGVSSHQFDTGDRGFSIRFDGPLDMRMNPNQGVSAAEWLNAAEVEEIAAVLGRYGEVEHPMRVARSIHANKPIRTTMGLIEALKGLEGRGKASQFLAQVFQALRMQVNNELAVLESMLQQSVEVLKSNGRLVVISYHSLEDRMVKELLRTGNVQGELKKDFYGNIQREMNPLKTKPILPTQEELERNKRSRSAKLRVGIKK
jgi:16S rRNA (cytosine1402-N4)-methyltransferase